MKLQSLTYFVLVTSNGKLIGIDQNSGGYPFETDFLGAANLWMKKELAEGYNLHFKNKNYKIKEITVSFK